jgi:hypothetical protein
MEDPAVVVRPKADRQRVAREQECDRYPVQSSVSMPATVSEPVSGGPPRPPSRFGETACPNCRTDDHVSHLRTPGALRKHYYHCATCGELWATLLDGTRY